MDGFTNAVGTVVVNDRRKNAAVGGARLGFVWLVEGDDTRLSGEVCNHQQVILSRLGHVVVYCAMS